MYRSGVLSVCVSLSVSLFLSFPALSPHYPHALTPLSLSEVGLRPLNRPAVLVGPVRHWRERHRSDNNRVFPPHLPQQTNKTTNRRNRENKVRQSNEERVCDPTTFSKYLKKNFPVLFDQVVIIAKESGLVKMDLLTQKNYLPRIIINSQSQIWQNTH